MTTLRDNYQPSPIHETTIKVLVRHDLKMGKGKMVAQAGHALLNLMEDVSDPCPRDVRASRRIVVLKVTNDELRSAMRLCQKQGLPFACQYDSGLTQVVSGTFTAMAVGPRSPSKFPPFFDQLKLL